MNYLTRLEWKIKRDYPEISMEELADRITLAKHLIAWEHEKRNLGLRGILPKDQCSSTDRDLKQKSNTIGV